MDYKSLIRNATLREFSLPDLLLPEIPNEGNRFLREAEREFSPGFAAYPLQDRFGETLEITSYPYGSASWYSDRSIRFVIWSGGLTIDGDLIDDDFSGRPVMIVRGDLTVRSWLRGGMHTFVGGSVRASGFIVGHYDDSMLFVGGNLTALGYVPRAAPFHDAPDVIPHQIAGRIDAKRFDARAAGDDELRAVFVDEVLTCDEEGWYLDEKAVIDRSNAGLEVWREVPAET